MYNKAISFCILERAYSVAMAIERELQIQCSLLIPGFVGKRTIKHKHEVYFHNNYVVLE